MEEYTDMFRPTFLADLENKKKPEFVRLPAFPKAYSATMAYIPFQQDTSTYDIEKALDIGTLYPELDKPFYGGRMMPR